MANKPDCIFEESKKTVMGRHVRCKDARLEPEIEEFSVHDGSTIAKITNETTGLLTMNRPKCSEIKTALALVL